MFRAYGLRLTAWYDAFGNVLEANKRDILKDVNDRLREKETLPPDLQGKLDEFEKDNTPKCKE